MTDLVKQEGNVDFDTMQRMASAVASSKLFGVKDTAQALSLMLISQAEGRHPALMAKEYYIVNGRPTLNADAMLSRFQDKGGSVEWKEYTATRVVGRFSHPQGGSLEIEWTWDMAVKAGLTKNATWGKYPRNMLRARCVSEGIRAVYPAICTGVYTPEEVKDMDDKTITPARVVEDNIPTQRDIEDFIADMIDADLWKHVNDEQEASLHASPSWAMIDVIRQSAVLASKKAEETTEPKTEEKDNA